ncbi:MAG: AraC family transcriptional regulator [Bacteroidota bacterium]
MEFLFEGFGFCAILLSGFCIFLFIHRLNRSLIAWIVLSALYIAYFLLLFNDQLPSDHWIHLLFYPLSLLSVPAFYLGLKQWSKSSQIQWKNYTLYALPYLLFVAMLFFFWWQEERISIIDGFLKCPSNMPQLLRTHNGTVLGISATIYLMLGLREINAYDKRLLKFYSNVDSKELKWLRNLIVGFFFAVVAITIVIVSATAFSAYDLRYTFQIVSTLNSILLILFWFNLTKQLVKIEDWQSEVLPIQEENASAKAAISYEAEIIKLEQIMQEEQLFLQSELDLQELATQLQLSRQRLSEVLNQGLQTNFYTYINNYRIEYAAQLLKHPKYMHFTAEGIGYESGFASRSTFFKLFKAKYSLSPAAYRKKTSV